MSGNAAMNSCPVREYTCISRDVKKKIKKKSLCAALNASVGEGPKDGNCMQSNSTRSLNESNIQNANLNTVSSSMEQIFTL